MFAQLSLRRSPLMVGTAAVLLSLGPPHMPSSIHRAHVPPWADLADKACISRLVVG